MIDARPSLGWATADLVHLDGLSPGLIARVLTTSPRRRQAILTVLASRAAGNRGGGAEVDHKDEADLADTLRHARAREILAHVFGHVPDGWMGALERFDTPSLASAHAYVQLQQIFADPRHRAKAELLSATGLVTERKLVVLGALDACWVLRGVLERIDSGIAANEANRALRWVQSVCSTATDEVLARAIERLPPDKSLADLVSRYIRRADRFPPHPAKADRDIRPIVTARDFVDAGLRHRNCLGDRIEDALMGRAAYAEFRGEAIIEFRPLVNGYGWLLHDVHGRRNALVPAEVKGAVRAKCLEIGIPYIDDSDHVPDLTRLCRFLRGQAQPVHRDFAPYDALTARAR